MLKDVKLLFGPYQMPKFRIGQWVRCHVRGLVKITGITDAPMQWPYTWRNKLDHRPSIVVCGDLVRALRRESESAIAHWWGASIPTVWRWRTALRIGQFTEGTRALHSRRILERLDEETLARMKEALNTAEAVQRRIEGIRGKPMPAHVKRILIKANKGRKASPETRRRMSEAQKRRDPATQVLGVVWTPEEVALLGTMTDKKVAKKIGRTPRAVKDHRYKLGIPPMRKCKPRCKTPNWTPNRLSLLGTMPDSAVARKVGCNLMGVFYQRQKRGAAVCGPVFVGRVRFF